MKRFVVGGNFGVAKKSGVAKKLAEELYADVCNGGDMSVLSFAKGAVVDYDLVVWMPNIDNEVPKDYPVKKKGSILICSKVIHDERTEGDAVARIFKMNANAVIAIDTSTENHCAFKLIDALGNLWIETDKIADLAKSIEKLAQWTKESKRRNTEYCPACVQTNKKVEQKFCDIVKLVATKVENERGGRYFGNASTRCAFMFPSKRLKSDGVYVSKRNMPKEHLQPTDFIEMYEIEDKLLYRSECDWLDMAWCTIESQSGFEVCPTVSGSCALKKVSGKPSVDAPIQVELYKKFPQVNYMIHGHAYIKKAATTNHYYPCGDLREIDAIMEILEPHMELIEQELEVFCVNLKNHGFIIFAENLEGLEDFVNGADFEYRQLEEKI